MDLGVIGDPWGRRALVWHRSPALAAVVAPTRVVLLDLDHVEQPARILGDTGAAIWHAIDGQSDEAGIVAAVAAAFGLDAELIRVDVARFLDELRNDHLVEAVPVAAGSA